MKISKSKAIENVIQAAKAMDSVLCIYVNDDGGPDAIGVGFNDVPMSKRVGAAIDLETALTQLDSVSKPQKKKAKKKNH